ncbi:MAG: DUF4097 domain-containing protein [Fidelibacterota bacterium]
MKLIILLSTILTVFSIQEAKDNYSLPSGKPVMDRQVMQEEKTESKIKFLKGGEIRIAGGDGNIAVRGWDREFVELEIIKTGWGRNTRDARKAIENTKIDIDSSSYKISIRVFEPSESVEVTSFWDLFKNRSWISSRVSLNLRVPEQVNLRLSADDGDIEVEGIEGDIKIFNEDGNIQLEGIKTFRTSIETDDGRIWISELTLPDTSHNSSMNLESDDGDINLSDIFVTELNIIMDDGDLRIKNARFQKLYTYLDDGTAHMDFYPEINGKFRIHGDDGNLRLMLPENISMEFDIISDNGDIYSDFPLTKKETDSGNIATGIVGDGESYLKIDTDGGDIEIFIK